MKQSLTVVFEFETELSRAELDAAVSTWIESFDEIDSCPPKPIRLTGFAVLDEADPNPPEED